MKTTLAERFEGKYLRRAAHECWPWIAVKNGGYGEIKAESGNRKHKAHRVAFEIHKGPIPKGLVVDHICRNPSCVNPNHLRAITKVENTMIGFGYYAINGRKTHCVNGHEFTPSNTLKHSGAAGGGRRCRTCKLEKEAARKRRIRAARKA